MRHRIGLLYGILLVLVLTMGVWWVYFLSHVGEEHAEHLRQKLANDKIHASFLMQSDDQILANPDKWLGESFPSLLFTKGINGIEITIDPAVLLEIEAEARSSRNMFLAEGLVFLLLLGGGSAILVYARRSEMRFKQARALFLAGATHEFKTPLASLRLYTETLGRDGLAEADRIRIRTTMIQDIDRLKDLVNDTLSLSADDSFSSPAPAVLNLEQECLAVIKEVSRFASDHNATIKFSGQADLLFSGQHLSFALALKNLLVNAVKHCPEPVNIKIQLKGHGKYHLVKVIDDGPGIARRLHEKVFECFYSGTCGERQSEGAGLGLYLVKRNIENLGGSVSLSSDEGSGCIFTLKLPATNKEQSGVQE